jgi:hypothetical protein
MWSACFVVFAFIVAVALGAARRKRFAHFYTTPCRGKEWRRQFPGASKAQIRAFLDCFVDSFGFNPDRRLCFSPSDQVMAIYKRIYPPRWTACDSLELEFFDMELERRYGLSLQAIWPIPKADITLGEIFEQVLTRRT